MTFSFKPFGLDCEQAYSKLPTEADPDMAPGIITEDWPPNREIEFVHYTMGYREDLLPVLNDLCFKVSEVPADLSEIRPILPQLLDGELPTLE
jgi:hypothetical protein